MLTERGRDFQPVIVAIHAWGNKHFAPEGASVLLVNATTGVAADPVMVDRKSGRPLTGPEFVIAPGPAAGEGIRRRLAASIWGHAHAANLPRPSFERHVIRKASSRS